MSERRRLAEIEKHLRVEDPRLAQTMADWPGEPWWRQQRGPVAGAVASIVALLTGWVLTGTGVGAVLVVLGGLGLLATIMVALWRRRSARRPVRKPHSRTQYVWRGRSGGEDLYPFGYWWYF